MSALLSRPPSPPHMTKAPQVGALPGLVAVTPLARRLANGLPVLLFPRHTAPTVAVHFVVRAGADRDPLGRAGLASLTAEMMDEGAGPRSAMELAESLEHMGTDLWLSAGRDGSQLALNATRDTWKPALALAADVLRRPRFETNDWERVLHDRQTALVQRRDQPESVAGLSTSATLFGPDHPYGRPVDGFEATVGALTLDDVRAFHERIWRPRLGTLVLCGDFDPDEAERELERLLGDWAPGDDLPSWSAPTAATLPRLTVVDRPEAPQSVVRVVGPAPSRGTPARAALSMLEIILGGSFTSRLNFKLREEKGFTYGASAGFNFYRQAGAFLARSSVFSQNTAESVQVFLDEIAGMTSRPASELEITKAKATLLDRTAESLSMAAGIASLYAELALFQRPLDEPATFVAETEGVDGAALATTARELLDPAKLAVVIVGPAQQFVPALEAAGWGKPLYRDVDGRPLD